MRVFACLVKKDLLLWWRARAFRYALLGFAALLVVVSSFSFHRVGFDESDLRAITPGILWLCFLFTSVSALNHSFSVEQENSALQGLVICPLDSTHIFFAKFLTNLLVVLCLELVILALHSLFFGINVTFAELSSLFLFGALFAVGFVALGTLFSAIAVCSRSRDILLPLLLFPLSVPLVLGSVTLAKEVLGGNLLPVENFWFSLLCVFDVLALVVSWATCPWLMRD